VKEAAVKRLHRKKTRWHSTWSFFLWEGLKLGVSITPPNPQLDSTPSPIFIACSPFLYNSIIHNLPKIVKAKKYPRLHPIQVGYY
jgi:hypothetical protein